MRRPRFDSIIMTLALVLLSTVALAQVPTTAPPLAEDRWVVRAFYDDDRMVSRLISRFTPWGGDPVAAYLILDVDAPEHQELIDMGFRVEIDERRTALYHQPIESLPGQGGGIAGFPCYPTVAETYAFAQDMVANHPDLAEWVDIGDSWEKTQNQAAGSDLWVLRLTNRNIAAPKPSLFVMGAVHAREYTTAALVTEFAAWLIDGYDLDADATWILDHNEVHLLLQANPDGRLHAETGLLWRKNTDDDFCTGTNQRGIDLNRNFSYMWGCCNGSSTDPCSNSFRGPSAASEPEIQAIEAYLLSIFPDQRGSGLNDLAPEDATGVFLDIHSFSELVLWSYGFTGALAPNGTALQTLGRKFAFFNGYLPLKISNFVIADGSTADFAYGELGVAAFGFELGTNFFQDCGTYQNEILTDNLLALIYAAKVARTPYQTPLGPDSRDLSLDDDTPAPGTIVHLSATIDDTRFNNSNGTEPVQPVAEAEVYLDVPPWDSANNPQPLALLPVDGNFDSTVEAVEVDLDTTGWPHGTHILYLRGRDVSGRWGAISAIFIRVVDRAALLASWPIGVSVLDLVPLYP